MANSLVYIEKVVEYVNCKLSTPLDEDERQDVAVRVLEHMHEYHTIDAQALGHIKRDTIKLITKERKMKASEDDEVLFSDLDEERFETYDPDFETLLTRHELSENIALVLNSLTPRECGVVRMRCGLLPSGKLYTYKAIGAKYGVSHNRAMAIWKFALQKLTHPSRRRYLESLYW